MRAALDAGLLPIDPRHIGTQDLDVCVDEHPVYVVTAGTLQVLTYIETKNSSHLVSLR
jgi:hypothetical protein